MKKLILILIIGLLVSTAAFADHDGTGIGVILGGGGGGNTVETINRSIHRSIGNFNVGFNARFAGLPVFWSFIMNFGGYRYYDYGLGWGGDHIGFSFAGDYYLIDKNIFKKSTDGGYEFILDWYLGLGGIINLNLVDHRWRGYDWDGFGLGLRVPAGVSWHITKELELALGLTPVFGVYIGGGTDYNSKVYAGFLWEINSELAFRYWFGKK